MYYNNKFLAVGPYERMQVEIVFAFWKMSLFCLCNQMMIQGEPTKMVSFCLSLSFSWCGFYFPPLGRLSWLILTGMGAYLPTLLPTTAFQNEQCEWCYRHFSVWKPSLLEEKRKKSFCTWTFSESFTTCRASSGYWLESRSFPCSLEDCVLKQNALSLLIMWQAPSVHHRDMWPCLCEHLLGFIVCSLQWYLGNVSYCIRKKIDNVKTSPRASEGIFELNPGCYKWKAIQVFLPK